MHSRGLSDGCGPRRGAVLVTALTTVVVLTTLAGGVLFLGMRSHEEVRGALELSKANLVATSGIAHAVVQLYAGNVDEIGTTEAPLAFSDGGYHVTIADEGGGFFTVTSTGTVRSGSSTWVAAVERVGFGIFQNALFAGNRSGDPSYSLDLGGFDVQRDEIDGDIYSAGDVELSADATVSGTVRAGGEIYGATGEAGEAGVSQPLPDLAGMNYELSADVDVASLFGAATWESADAGGSAWQVPEESPAHIFRKNPSDRTSETASTAKDDFFLEDPYEPVGSDPGQDGTDPYAISLSGVSGEPGADSNKKVFFVDGNLWIHNMRSYSFAFEHSEPDGVQVTFVVKGNIYFSDNIFYDQPETDGVLFIAMNDSAHPDESGNIYFGDPEFGTLREMNAFLYAENNFYDVNLDEDGSTVVEVNGIMTAGNQVVIDRDYDLGVDADGDGESDVAHTKLVVDFDPRIADGELDMAGLPSLSGADEVQFVVRSWMRRAQG